jgi:FkbM family methyltransferase
MTKRPGTSDHAIVLNVMINNEYRLPDNMKDWVAIDIGAHIGAFAMACVERGATVIAIEPVKENYDLLCENTVGKPVYRVNSAVWGYSTQPLCFSGFPRINDEEINTGGARLSVGQGEHTLLTFYDLDDVIRSTLLDFDKIDLVKMDCEYAEWDIFYGGETLLLRHVPRVIGEFHEDSEHPRFDSCNEQGLINFFQAKGYTVKTERHGDTNLGMFWAERTS